MKIDKRNIKKRKWNRPDFKELSISATKGGGPADPPETDFNFTAS